MRLGPCGFLVTDKAEIPVGFDPICIDSSFFLAYQEIYFDKFVPGLSIAKVKHFSNVTSSRKVEHSFRFDLLNKYDQATSSNMVSLCQKVRPNITSVMLEDVKDKPVQPTIVGSTPLEVWFKARQSKQLEPAPNLDPHQENPHKFPLKVQPDQKIQKKEQEKPKLEIVLDTKSIDSPSESNDLFANSSMFAREDQGSPSSLLGKRSDLYEVSPHLTDLANFYF